MGLIESAFLLLIEYSLPVYRHNIGRERPPVAHRENVNAAAAIVMLVTALEYHLCRLKYLRDVTRHKPPLPYTPYFNWSFDNPFSEKLKKLLIRSKERRLLRQLIELTVCRDCIVHPKFYTVTESWNADFSIRSIKAKLPPGVTLRPKAVMHQMKRKHLTKLLRLPLVPTWISYADAVVCMMVLHRLINLLEFRYGNPYAWVGGITAHKRQTKELFTGWDWQRSHPRELIHWVKGFLQSLSPHDQEKVRHALGGRLAPYLNKRHPKLISLGKSKRSLSEIFDHTPKTRKPDFLYKPPPHLLSRR